LAVVTVGGGFSGWQFVVSVHTFLIVVIVNVGVISVVVVSGGGTLLLGAELLG
jgi:hypothetical protein